MIYGSDIWLQGGLAAALVLAGLVAVLMKRSAAKHNARVLAELKAGESIRLLALAYQGQGKLDLAWQTFQTAPASNLLADDLYYLASDYEKAAQPKKAIVVLRRLHERHPAYRDSDEMLARAGKQAVMAKAAEAMRSAPAPDRPRFGAFEMHGELGKGAIGVVYRGVDPTLGREVALKTLPLAQEFDGEQLDQAREIFFEEVRRAATLSHPNIVTIYDTGEERRVCFVAMELFKGVDLAGFTNAGGLLPREKAVEIAARAAEALDYAHSQGALHLDMRPGNILYDANSDVVKLTDFGIARITAKLKTRSGASIGAEAYQSPEQRAGGDVDGRSDLYSLAATLHQLLTGELPTVGKVDEALPEALAKVLRRALAQNRDERLASGAELSGALTAAVSIRAASTAEAETALDISL